MPNAIFDSTQRFKQHFIEQLLSMMSHQEIGVFILVLANAISKPEIHQQLATALAHRYRLIEQRLRSMPDTEIDKIAVDDLSVFRALGQIDFNDLALASSRTQGKWQLQFNPLRSFRPARSSQQKISVLYQPFDPHSFHFNKTFLSKEILWQGKIANVSVRLLYNKFPFADYHGLLLINPEQQNPQFLQQQDCLNTQMILQRLSVLDGFGLAYNSLGAFASINHQHWQMFLAHQPYPVEHSCWSHNAGATDYPLRVEKFNTLILAWPSIEAYQHSNTSFNLLLRADVVYLVTRKRQGEYVHSRWTSGFAWSEIMGNVMTTALADYERLTTQAIDQEFLLLRP